MKKAIITIILFVVCGLSSIAQNPLSWESWHWLGGTWKGEGDGNPGHGTGVFTFSYDLDSQIMQRKSSTSYPETGNKQAFVHNDLMIIYADADGLPSKAIYFDNEGHCINYSAVFEKNKIILTSEKAGGTPIFRLTYEKLAEKIVNVIFAVSTDGETFRTYVEGISRKVD